MPNLIDTIFIYAGKWTHRKRHDMPRHKGHKKVEFIDMTVKQIHELMLTVMNKPLGEDEC